MGELLRIEQLKIRFESEYGRTQAVRGASLHIDEGETLAVVGESGCGKSVMGRSILGLLCKNAMVEGSIRLCGREIVGLGERALQDIRGRDAAIVFQDPMTSLTPTMPVGRQIAEAARIHTGLSRRQARERAIDLMAMVGIERPAERFGQYPHQFSGGMRQRCVFAMALAGNPRLLIADEPTTALDVTIQAKILELMADIRRQTRIAMLLITHDLGVVAQSADRVAVMYAGKIVETGTVREVFYDPRHPYTWGLMSSSPAAELKNGRLRTIEGALPRNDREIHGDAFAPRNPFALAIDYEEEPPMFQITETHSAATWLLDKRAPRIAAAAFVRDGKVIVREEAECRHC